MQLASKATADAAEPEPGWLAQLVLLGWGLWAVSAHWCFLPSAAKHEPGWPALLLVCLDIVAAMDK